MRAAEVKDALRRRHGIEAWVCIEEAFGGWATSGGGVDLLAVGVWKTAKATGLVGAGSGENTNPIVAYEVKVSRSDFRRELYGYVPGQNAGWRTRARGAVPGWPLKAHWALERSHYFMFAVPKGLLKDEEVERREKPEDGKGLWLPPEAGLVEVDTGGCHVRVNAPRRPAPPALSRHEVGELLRHVSAPNKARAALTEVNSLRDDLRRSHLRENEQATTIEDLEDRIARLRIGVAA